MLPQLLLGSFLALATTAVHSALTVLVARWLRALHAEHPLLRTYLSRSSLMAGIVLLVLLAAGIEGAIWALSYLQVGAFQDFGTALYFSMVTFTTLGYGDITLGEEWRLLASFQAAIGIIMFGWTTAIIVVTIQRIVQLVYGSTITAG